ncbi:MAG: hypothetical protein ACTHJS_04260 [Xanthobacteraceae bacterium]
MDIFAERTTKLQERHLRRLLDETYSAHGNQHYSIVMSGKSPRSATADIISNSFVRALANDSKLPPAVRSIPGLSGQKYRSFINNALEELGKKAFVEELGAARYLEIGCWAGSTATAALYGNSVKCLCIDNWSEFGGPKNQFFANIESVRSDKIDFAFIEKDFRTIDYGSIGKFNVYVFDGPHLEADQFDGIRLAQPALENSYILIVDDWNWTRVREGTLRGLIETACEVEMSIEVRTTLDNSHAEIVSAGSDWHNGYFIAAIKKRG